MATEVKVVVVSLYNTPKVIPTFFTLAGQPKTEKEQNQFTLMVAEACEMYAMKDGNTIILNESTDGVACEIQFNKTLTLS